MKWIASLLALLLSASFAAGTEAPDEREELTEDLAVVKLTDGVWRHVSAREMEEYGRVTGNGLVVVDGEEAAIIDTPWTEEQTSALIAWVSRTLGARVTVVVPTHSHGDCMGGLAAAHRLGADSYASETTAAFARRDGNEVPRHVFSDSLEVELGSKTLRLHFAGAGHTVDNIVVWIPEERILFGGCLVRSAGAKRLGYTAEGDLEAWPATIRALSRDYGDARWIVPGHGSPGGKELFERTLKLLADDP